MKQILKEDEEEDEEIKDDITIDLEDYIDEAELNSDQQERKAYFSNLL